ncbi:S-adenosyl-L-methionine-dependent methyltransferase [Neoconidiobolus thromboides FSU 785]|nr:S-adenosyl-L-methionine-dependent methyltransferase [Neoconidiobolus thromboides FSU 785]
MVNGFIPLARTESITGWITVDEEKAREIRVLRSGHSIIGGIYPNYQESIFGTFYYMETIKFLLPYKSTEERGNVLQIGLGIGVSAKDLIEDDYKVDIIEIDPIVYNYSRTYFELPEPNKVYLEDGRTVLENKIKGSSYDFILHDVFTGGTVPSTLFSIEALQLCKYAMKPDGVLVLNFVGGILGPYNMAFEMVATTLRAVFPYMRLFTEDFKDNEEEVVSNLINLVFFVSDKPIEFDLPPISPTYRSIKEHAITHMEKYEVKLEKYLPQLTKDLELIDKYHSMVVTDKDNKLNQVQHHSAYEHWYKMKELFPLEYWVKY